MLKHQRPDISSEWVFHCFQNVFFFFKTNVKVNLLSVVTAHFLLCICFCGEQL